MNRREKALREIAETMRNEGEPISSMGTHAVLDKGPRGNRALSPVSWYPKTKALKRELQMMAWNEETSMAALLHEGLEVVFERRGKNIADYL